MKVKTGTLKLINEGWPNYEAATVIICEDEIKEGDLVLEIFANGDKNITRATNMSSFISNEQHKFQHKILVSPKQFPAGFIQLIFEGKAKDGDKVRVLFDESDNSITPFLDESLNKESVEEAAEKYHKTVHSITGNSIDEAFVAGAKWAKQNNY